MNLHFMIVCKKCGSGKNKITIHNLPIEIVVTVTCDECDLSGILLAHDKEAE